MIGGLQNSVKTHPARTSRPDSGQEFDVLIQGAGINGAATAEDLARRGLKVGLLDMNDIGAGTTAYSSRLIHGGLRYLANGPKDFPLVRESLREREILLSRAPHLVRPLPLGLTAYQGTKLNKRLSSIAMRLYDWLSYDKSLPKFKMFSRDKMLALFPGLRQEALQGGALYYDAQAPLPERLALEYAMAARENGATVLTHTRVEEVLTEPVEAGNGNKRVSRKVAQANRQATGVRATDVLTGEEFVLKARVVINATGSWVDEALKQVGNKANAPSSEPSSSESSRHMGELSSESSRRMGELSSDFSRRMGGTKGSHILVSRFNEALKDNALSFESSDGRHMFIEPFNKDYLLIGTTDIHYEGNPGKVVADRQELQYLIRETNRMFPDAGLKIDDIHWAYSGVRPLPYAPPDTPPGKITRKHIIEDHSQDPKSPVSGLVSLIGGKITTARSLAEEAADQIIADYNLPDSPFRGVTRQLSLPGGQGIDKGKIDLYKDQAWENARPKMPWLERPVLDHLIDLYGSQYKTVLTLAKNQPELREPLAPDSRNIAAQVVYAVQSEMAATVSDIQRRTGAILNEQAGLDELDSIARILKNSLDWPEELVAQDVESYKGYVAFQNQELWKMQGRES